MSDIRPVPMARRKLLWLQIFALCSLSAAQAAPVPQAARHYMIDKRHGSIEFSVSHLGLFSSHGAFRDFDADLIIDRAHPEQTHVDVSIAAASVEMPWQDGVAMLRSADFFDVARYPDVRFHSTSVAALAPDRYAVSGMLELRGVSRPMALIAHLVQRHDDPAGEPISADFDVTGTLSRAAFGMVSEQTFISDTVRLTIRARIALADAG